MSITRCGLAPLGVVILLGTIAMGQPPVDLPADPPIATFDKQVIRFFEELASEDTPTLDAFKKLAAGSAMAEVPEALQGIAAKVMRGEHDHGRFISAEQIKVRRVGKDLVILVYLAKYEQSPVVWYFAYYRDYRKMPPPDAIPNDKTAGDKSNRWMIILFWFDTKLLQLIEE